METENLTAQDAISQVEAFSELPDHGQMVALVVHSHGNTQESIVGVDGRPCLVQQLVDALCSRLPNIPKVLYFFSYLQMVLSDPWSNLLYALTTDFIVKCKTTFCSSGYCCYSKQSEPFLLVYCGTKSATLSSIL